MEPTTQLQSDEALDGRMAVAQDAIRGEQGSDEFFDSLGGQSFLKHRAKKDLASFFKKMEKRTAHHLGYPYNLQYDYSELSHFLNFTLLNLGDPFVDSNYKIDSREYEKEVLAFFGDLYEIDKTEIAGYVTSGGTEGNIYGMYVASSKYPEANLYLTRDTHYSIGKAAKMMRIPVVVVESDENGEMNYEDLEKKLSSRQNAPAIVNVTIGTTVKGAIDDVDRVLEVLERQGVGEHYIHCDAALGGLIVPFIKGAPEVVFSKPIDSVAISGHKFLGVPIPCGVVLTRREHLRYVETDIEYIGSKDTTILGARCGLAPIFMWYAIKTRGMKRLAEEAEQCLRNAKYLASKLASIDHPSLLHKYSTIVWMMKPHDSVIKKWQLAVENDGAHVVVMQNVDRQKIDLFIADLEAAR